MYQKKANSSKRFFYISLGADKKNLFKNQKPL